MSQGGGTVAIAERKVIDGAKNIVQQHKTAFLNDGGTFQKSLFKGWKLCSNLSLIAFL